MSSSDRIEQFLSGKVFAVVGASKNREKFGNQVLRCYLRHGYTAYPINPVETEIEGRTVYKKLADLPQPVHGVSIITPAAVTEQVVDEAIALGIRHLWMQPGAESAAAIQRAESSGVNVIANGPCLLVELAFGPR